MPGPMEIHEQRFGVPDFISAGCYTFVVDDYIYFVWVQSCLLLKKGSILAMKENYTIMCFRSN